MPFTVTTPSQVICSPEQPKRRDRRHGQFLCHRWLLELFVGRARRQSRRGRRRHHLRDQLRGGGNVCRDRHARHNVDLQRDRGSPAPAIGLFTASPAISHGRQFGRAVVERDRERVELRDRPRHRRGSMQQQLQDRHAVPEHDVHADRDRSGRDGDRRGERHRHRSGAGRRHARNADIRLHRRSAEFRRAGRHQPRSRWPHPARKVDEEQLAAVARGNGGSVTATIAVTPGETLAIFVGGAGGNG